MDRTKDVPEVTQADRERALEAMMLPSDDFLAPHWMSGRCDSGPLLQALSRHRTEATRPLTAEIADLRAQLDEANTSASDAWEKNIALDIENKKLREGRDKLLAEITRRDANETRNCINWGPCSMNDGDMGEKP